jgi:hypothetical protein
MKHFFFASLLIMLSSNCDAGLFSPKNYDDCILDGVKSAKTDLAVRAVYESCRSKFPEGKTGAKRSGICEIYWDGWKLTSGSKNKGAGYLTYTLEKDNIYTFELGIPGSMADSFKSSPLGLEQSLLNFVAPRWNEIQKLCK